MLLNETPSAVFAEGSANLEAVRQANDLDSVGLALKFPSGSKALIDVRRTNHTTKGRIEVISIFRQIKMYQTTNRCSYLLCL